MRATALVAVVFAVAIAFAVAADAAPPIAAPTEPAAADGGAVANLRVAVSSEVAGAFGELGDAWAKQSGLGVVVVKAPPEVSLAKLGAIDLLGGGRHALADASAPSGCDPRSEQHYARGRLVVWVKSGAPPSPAELVDARWKKIAIGEPNQAPYGRAANQALEHAGVLAQVMPRLVYQPDSADALALAQTGGVDAALTALALAGDDKSRYTIVSPELYTPISESLIICGHDAARTAAAKRFVAFVLSAQAAPILKRHGLSP